MGESKWKKNMDASEKLGTNIAEAHAHALIKDNYFTWLLECKLHTAGHEIKTEYEQSTSAGEGDEWEDTMFFPKDLCHIEVCAPDASCEEFKLVTEEDDKEAYKRARERRREIQEKMGQKVASSSKKRVIKLVSTKHNEYKRQEDKVSTQESRKRKRRSCSG